MLSKHHRGLIPGSLIIGLVVFLAGLRVTAGPPTQSDDTRCRLAAGENCSFSRPGDGAVGTLIKQTNPPIDARGVPTYTLVAVTFATEMKAETIRANTFYVQRDNSRVSGSVGYIAGSNMAVFYPDDALQPNTSYTVTVTTGGQTLADEVLVEDFVWSFTTYAQPFSIGGEVTAAGIPVDGLHVYYGDLHTHSGYADNAYLPGTPAEAFATGRANGLEFMALTGHDTYLNQARWQEILTQAEAATTEGVFVGLRGFEFKHPAGHLNVFNTDTFVRWTDPAYRDNLEVFYVWLTSQPGAIGQFNHPGPGINFYDFAYYGAVDQKIVLREVLDVYQALLSLNRGWHLGTLLNSDTHVGNWGSQKFMGLVASGLTESAILEAVRARRTFYVPPDGQRFALVMQANGRWMGSAIPNTETLNFKVTAYDPNAGGKKLKVVLYDNGGQVAQTNLQTRAGVDTYTWTPAIPAQLGHYYYVEAFYDGWYYSAYSSPVWVEQAPLASAGRAQTVAPGTVVTLDGSQSSDPDGDVLAYQWTQLSGSPAQLSLSQSAQLTFTAPITLGSLDFRLTVTDTGSLNDSDRTTVTITDQPILSISKSGPVTADPGELITYTLTVTNNGLNPATRLVVTDAVPTGATYVGGGTLMPGNVVSWTIPTLATTGGRTQVSFVVATTGTILNKDYRVSCAEGVSAAGEVTVLTNPYEAYLPVIMKN